MHSPSIRLNGCYAFWPRAAVPVRNWHDSDPAPRARQCLLSMPRHHCGSAGQRHDQQGCHRTRGSRDANMAPTMCRGSSRDRIGVAPSQWSGFPITCERKDWCCSRTAFVTLTNGPDVGQISRLVCGSSDGGSAELAAKRTVRSLHTPRLQRPKRMSLWAARRATGTDTRRA